MLADGGADMFALCSPGAGAGGGASFGASEAAGAMADELQQLSAGVKPTV